MHSNALLNSPQNVVVSATFIAILNFLTRDSFSMPIRLVLAFLIGLPMISYIIGKLFEMYLLLGRFLICTNIMDVFVSYNFQSYRI